MTKRLAGKSALVTGGSRGIGAAIAKALADEGANVAISYSSSASQAESIVNDIKAKGVKSAAFKADQADAKQVENLVKSAAQELGKLDILVNNAGMYMTAPIDADVDQAAINRQYAINLGGVTTAIRAAAKIMPEGGRIITIGSGIASRVGYAGVADYAATKAAVVGFSKGAARDLAAKKITVNVLEPGSIDTDMNPANGPYSDYQRAGIPLGRFGKPEEIAAGVVYLASPEASYVTGAVLNVDGGFTS